MTKDTIINQRKNITTKKIIATSNSINDTNDFDINFPDVLKCKTNDIVKVSKGNTNHSANVSNNNNDVTIYLPDSSFIVATYNILINNENDNDININNITNLETFVPVKNTTF